MPNSARRPADWAPHSDSPMCRAGIQIPVPSSGGSSSNDFKISMSFLLYSFIQSTPIRSNGASIRANLYQMSIILMIGHKNKNEGFQSNLHKELTLQLCAPYANSVSTQDAATVSSPGIHVYLTKQELGNFKTQSCLNVEHYDNHNYHNIHHSMEAPYYYSCFYYHSDKDRRRVPYASPEGDTDKLAYEDIYIADNFATEYCANWVEYLYHPKVYKVKICTNLACHRRFCAKLHKNEQPSQHPSMPVQDQALSHNHILLESIRELGSLKNIPNLAALQANSALSQKISKAQNNLMKFVQKLDKLDKEEEKKLSNIKNEIISLANANTDKPREKSKTKDQKPIKKDSKQEGTYDRLFYNEKLKIIEDREHQFKMFKDKDPKRIAAMVLEYISAFLNSDGGSIYLGINDESIVHGLEVDNRWLDQFQLAIDSDGRNHLNPPLIPQKYRLKIIPVVHHKKAQLKVIQIQVLPQSESDKKILTLYKKQCYLRMNASNHRLSAADIMQYMRLVSQKKQPGLVPQNEDKLEEMNPKELKEYQEHLSKMNTRITGLIRKKQREGATSAAIGENEKGEEPEPVS